MCTSIEKASQSIAPEAEGTSASSTAQPMDDVFRVNCLLQIEDLDCTCQLQQVISNFLIPVY